MKNAPCIMLGSAAGSNARFRKKSSVMNHGTRILVNDHLREYQTNFRSFAHDSENDSESRNCGAPSRAAR